MLCTSFYSICYSHDFTLILLFINGPLLLLSHGSIESNMERMWDTVENFASFVAKIFKRRVDWRYFFGLKIFHLLLEVIRRKLNKILLSNILFNLADLSWICIPVMCIFRCRCTLISTFFLKIPINLKQYCRQIVAFQIVLFGGWRMSSIIFFSGG